MKNNYYLYGLKIDTKVTGGEINVQKKEVDTLIFYRDLYNSDDEVESREILYSEIIPPSAIAEISAYCTTTWEDSCPKDIRDKCYGRIKEEA